MMKYFSKIHVALFRLTKGRLGGSMDGMPLGLLTTTGRKTGAARTKPLMVFEDNGRYVVVASMGGAPKNPAWYLNVQANPEVTLELTGQGKKHLIAGTATEEEHIRLWNMIVSEQPRFEGYQKNTKRQIPVVILREPTVERSQA